MKQTQTTTDFLIIGAGIIGLSIAQTLRHRYPDAKIIVIEKEKEVGLHASGRNSGVLHAGFYYTKDSLKARFTKLGNEALTTYCLEKKISINRCGKLVVARDAQDLIGLQELLRRGQQNKIALELITAKEAKEIEPNVRTFEQALFSPSTSSVNPKEVLKHLCLDMNQMGISIHFNTKYLRRTNDGIATNKVNYACAFVINAAGLYADKIARDFGFSKNYYILPFKGLYLYANNVDQSLRTHIYPVPDLNYPFLGVHFTVGVDGAVKIGPTAIPAFWREQYEGLSRFLYL